jgi:hypothetical protein
MRVNRRAAGTLWAAAIIGSAAPGRSGAVVAIRIEDAVAAAGEPVTVTVSLAGEGAGVIAMQNDILFDPAVVTLDPRTCRIAPHLSDRLAECEDDPRSGPCKQLHRAVRFCEEEDLACPDGSTGLMRFRAIVFTISNTNAIPDGPLYSCTVVPTGAAGSVRLANRNVVVSGLAGALPAIGSDGIVTVIGAGTVRPTRPPTPTPSPTNSSPTRSPTATRTRRPTPRSVIVRVALREGSTVTVSMETNGFSVAAIRHLMLFDPLRLGELLECHLNPGIAAASTVCAGENPDAPCKSLFVNVDACEAPECPRGWQELRTAVFSPSNVNPIPDGELYSCTFSGQRAGLPLIETSAIVATAPDGQRAPVVAIDPQAVLLPPETVAEPTATRRPAAPTPTVRFAPTAISPSTPGRQPTPAATRGLVDTDSDSTENGGCSAVDGSASIEVPLIVLMLFFLRRRAAVARRSLS